MRLAAMHGDQGRARFALGFPRARLGRAGSGSLGVLASLVRGWQTRCEVGWSSLGLERAGRAGVRVGRSRGRRGLPHHSSHGLGVNLAGGREGSSKLSVADGWPKRARLEVEGREEEEELEKRKEKVGRKEKEKKKREKYPRLGSDFSPFSFFFQNKIFL